MSFVSVLPFGDTFEHWWRELDGDPGRLRFMALKTLEASAFMGNRLAHRGRTTVTSPGQAPIERQPMNAVPDHPVVVVIVPVYCQSQRDARRVDALLRGLETQSYPCHPVLIDDGSPHWQHRSGIEIIQLGRNLGPATARNRGLDRAIEIGAHVVAFTDSDCIPGPGWIRSLVSAFQKDRRAHAISGATWSLDRSSLGRYHERNGTLNGRRLHGEDFLLYGPTCNLAVSAELARGMRFDESFRIAAAEDIDFCYRANLLGWSIHHAERAVVHHNYGYDGVGWVGKFLRFWRQHRRYARGEKLLLKKHPSYVEAFADSTEIPLRDAATTGDLPALPLPDKQTTPDGEEPPETPKRPLPGHLLERLRRKLKRLKREDSNNYPLW